MDYAVIVFPGSNCDTDCYYAIQDEIKANVEFVWHAETKLPKKIDYIIVPGGFSYGDYLRAGAIAKFAKIMPEVVKFADSGGQVIGICNGFQILTEVGLLPGALIPNTSHKFVCKEVSLKVSNAQTKFTKSFEHGQIINMPIAHGEGRYHISQDGLKDLYENDQVAFKYVSQDGKVDLVGNPNGSIDNIAGIFNKKKNVLGMMPHPERCNFHNREALNILNPNEYN